MTAVRHRCYAMTCDLSDAICQSHFAETCQNIPAASPPSCGLHPASTASKQLFSLENCIWVLTAAARSARILPMVCSNLPNTTLPNAGCCLQPGFTLSIVLANRGLQRMVAGRRTSGYILRQIFSLSKGYSYRIHHFSLLQ